MDTATVERYANHRRISFHLSRSTKTLWLSARIASDARSDASADAGGGHTGSIRRFVDFVRFIYAPRGFYPIRSNGNRLFYGASAANFPAVSKWRRTGCAL